MRTPLALMRNLLLAVLGAPLAACGSSDDNAVQVAVIGDKNAPFEKGIYLSLAGQLARAAQREGLVSFDEQARVVPAIADQWIVTDDGTSYIFRLRDSTWRGGTAIRARDVRTALQDAIKALKGSSLALDLAGIEEIRVMTDRVIEIRLSRPMPHFLQLLAQPELGLRFKGQSAGPMELERSGDTAVLTPIDPAELGLPAIERWKDMVRQVRLEAFPAEEAVERLNQGGASVVLGGSIVDFPLSGRVGILRGTIQVDPVTGLLGLQVQKAKAFLSEPLNREAIAMAVDRQSLIAPFGINGWVATTRLVPPGLDGDTGTIGERWSDLSLEQRRAEAAGRVARWRAREKSEDRVKLSIWLPPGPGSDMLFSTLAGNLSAIGIELGRASSEDAAEMRLVDDVARYPRAAWFLNRLSCTSKRGLCDPGADALVALAMKTDDPQERVSLLAEAEADMTIDNFYIPFGAPIRWSLVRGDASGFATNRQGWHPLMPMAMKPR